MYLTNSFHVAVRLFIHRSMTSKCGKNKKSGDESSVSLMFLPPFEVFCDLLWNRRQHETYLFYAIKK